MRKQMETCWKEKRGVNFVKWQFGFKPHSEFTGTMTAKKTINKRAQPKTLTPAHQPRAYKENSDLCG